MGNKIIYMILGGVFIFGWFYTGYQPHYAAEGGGISAGWYFLSFVALALGAGDAGDAGNPFEALVNGLKSFIPSFIALLVSMLIARSIYELFMNDDGFQIMGLVDALSAVAATSVLTVLVMTCLRQAK